MIKALLDEETIAVFLLIAAVLVLGFAYIARPRYPQLIDRLHGQIDVRYEPVTQTEKWLYEIGFVKLKGGERYAKAAGAYATDFDYEVNYADLFRNSKYSYGLSLDGMRGVVCAPCTEDGELIEATIDEIEKAVNDYTLGLCHTNFNIDYEE